MIQPNANMWCFNKFLGFYEQTNLIQRAALNISFDISKAILIQALNEQPSTEKK